MLYLIESGEYIKIGYTKNEASYKRRVMSYRTMNPNFEILDTTEGSQEDEKMLQTYYKKINTEWTTDKELVLKIWNGYKNKESFEGFRQYVVSYQQLLKDYINNPDPSYDIEYPEFKEIVKYLKESEMNTLGWNKDKMLKRVQDLKVLNKVFLLVHREGFISNAELKSLFKFEFDKIGLKITPKASLIEQCSYYDIKKTFKKINGKTVGGYELFPINLST